MSKKNTVPDEQTKWFQRGFQSKHEYVGWLRFNDLVDESYGYDDTYHDQYSGRTIKIGDATVEEVAVIDIKEETK